MSSELEGSTCQRCSRSLSGRSVFRLKSGSGSVEKCMRCAVRHPSMLRTSALTSVVVGTALVVLNQGDVILSGMFPSQLLWKIPLTYVVPFLVASWGALVNSRR